MKKKLLLIVILTLIFSFTLSVLPAYAIENVSEVDNQQTNQNNAKSACLIDFDTGKVLYERNADEKLQIASMVKIMTLLLTFEEIEKGSLSFDTILTVSESASSMGGSQMFLETGDKYSVNDLLKGIVVSSANDACVLLAENISGTTELFVDKMNKKAKELGMINTCFVNPTGLPKDGQYSSAKDVGIMMKELLTHKEYYNYAGIYMENYTHPDGRNTQMVNTNKLIKQYSGCDAGKTGFTNNAMFCLSATAKKDNFRVISTVIGGKTSKDRFREVTEMFNLAFANYQKTTLIKANEELGSSSSIKSAKNDEIKIGIDKDITILEKKGVTKNYQISYELYSNIKAPLKQGERIGKLTINDENGEFVESADIITLESVEKATYLDYIKKVMENFIYQKSTKRE